MFGLCGAHHTGKTTLAKSLGETREFTFVQTNLSHCHEGFDMENLNYTDRITVQLIMLDHMRETMGSAPSDAIFDRTPIDLLVYATYHLDRDVENGKADRAIVSSFLKTYWSECSELAREFDGIICIQPGIALSERPGKPLPSEANIELLNIMTIGALMLFGSQQTDCSVGVLVRSVVDIAERTFDVASILNECRRKPEKSKASFEVQYSGRA